MATSTLVPLQEYLHSSYEPECEWIDGVLKEKSMPDGYHAYFQTLLLTWFKNRETAFGLRALSEVRIKVSETHYRVPDVLLIPLSARFLPSPTATPLVCIEILSPDDRIGDLMAKVDDYCDLQVGATWIIDPRRRTLALADRSGLHNVSQFAVPGTDSVITSAEIFAELDSLERM